MTFALQSNGFHKAVGHKAVALRVGQRYNTKMNQTMLYPFITAMRGNRRKTDERTIKLNYNFA